MFFTGTDMFEGDGAAATFNTVIKSQGDGQVVVKTYATSGMTAKRAYFMHQFYTTSGTGWFQPRVASILAGGLPGIASAAIASGCVGWVTVRGQVSDASFPASIEGTGSIGHAVFILTHATGALGGLGASSSAYLGASHQIGFLIETSVTATLATDIFLTGNEHCRPKEKT
jgi:hypothetical protein